MKVLSEDKQKIGAVAVLGGGIGGMQSALDLAESGFKVYLIENSPAIGGTMSRLDKTFPTNDCAMCIMSPKLVECGRHLNIEILTYSELEDIEGEPGNFKIAVRKRARSVDISKCTGCGECMNNCPVRNTVVIPQEPGEKAELKPEDMEKVREILERHRYERGFLIPVLQEINSAYKYLPREILRYVSQELEVPLTQILRVATFYNAFSLKPRGRHLISICLGTACFVKGSGRILEKIERDLKVRSGETTGDMRFSLEAARCIGCCALAPAVRVDDDVYGRLKLEQISRILDQYR